MIILSEFCIVLALVLPLNRIWWNDELYSWVSAYKYIHILTWYDKISIRISCTTKDSTIVINQVIWVMFRLRNGRSWKDSLTVTSSSFGCIYSEFSWAAQYAAYCAHIFENAVTLRVYWCDVFKPNTRLTPSFSATVLPQSRRLLRIQNPIAWPFIKIYVLRS